MGRRDLDSEAVVGCALALGVVIVLVAFMLTQTDVAQAEQQSEPPVITEPTVEPFVEIEEETCEPVEEDSEPIEESEPELIEEIEIEVAAVCEEIAYAAEGLTKLGGVYHYEGRTETWYSSNVLYHVDTGQWWLDDEGHYRTEEGYYVVAASDLDYGTVFEGSKGLCQVLDCGCAEGVTDYYVAW